MLLTVPTAVVEMGNGMEVLLLHQAKDMDFKMIIHKNL